MQNSEFPNTENKNVAFAYVAWQIVMLSIPKHANGHWKIAGEHLKTYLTNSYIEVYAAISNSTPLVESE